MKRVLQVLGTTNLGGAESRIMDLYRHINRERIQFDFLVHSKNGYFEKEIKELGGEIYYLPSFRVYNYYTYKKSCRDFFMKHSDYVAVHGHMTSTASIYLKEAKKAGILMTIAHARSAGVDKGIKGILTKFLRRNLYKKCDVMMACSDLAAIAVFGEKRWQAKKVIIMPNAIDTREFSKNQQVRDQIRKQYNIGEGFVIGHVGRFHYAKNHDFLLDIFEQVSKKRKDAILMLIGDGPLKAEMELKAKQLHISDKVIFTGRQNPIAPYYQALDFFLFPSHFEGMPGSVIEAQATGLKCLVSDTVTKQVKATELVTFESLKKSKEEWAAKLIEMITDKQEIASYNLEDTMYDVNKQVTYYTNLYLVEN